MSMKYCFGSAMRTIVASGILLSLVGGGSAGAADTTFRLFVSQDVKACLTKPGQVAKVFARVTPGPQNDTMVLQLEGFPETFNAGYFMIRVALVLLAALVLLEAVRDGLTRKPPAK